MEDIFYELRPETVWKFGIGPESGLREQPRGVEGVPIGRLLPPKKCGRDAFSYFPNSFSTHSGEYRPQERPEPRKTPALSLSSRLASSPTESASSIAARTPRRMRRENRRLAKEIGHEVREGMNKNFERGLRTNRSMDVSDARRLARKLAGGARISRAL
jgi:hypothetical protein